MTTDKTRAAKIEEAALRIARRYYGLGASAPRVQVAAQEQHAGGVLLRIIEDEVAALPTEAAGETDAGAESGASLIAAERLRQIQGEGRSPEWDARYKHHELAKAAAVYLLGPLGVYGDLWPWDPAWFKPTTRTRDLVKAGALVAAEIDRIKNQGESPQGSGASRRAGRNPALPTSDTEAAGETPWCFECQVECARVDEDGLCTACGCEPVKRDGTGHFSGAPILQRIPDDTPPVDPETAARECGTWEFCGRMGHRGVFIKSDVQYPCPDCTENKITEQSDE